MDQDTYGVAHKVLVVGLGNVRLQDEGVGVRAVQALGRAYRLPPNVVVVEGEEPGFDLLDAMEEAEHVVAVDCAFAGEAPGTMFRVPLDEYERPGEVPESLHEGRLLEALGVLEMLGRRPPAVLIAVQVDQTAPGTDLSPAVAARLPAVVEAIARELARLGIHLAPAAG